MGKDIGIHIKEKLVITRIRIIMSDKRFLLF